MDAQVEAAIKACIKCQSHGKSAVTSTTPLQPVPYPKQAWEKFAIDVVGPFNGAPIDCRFAVTVLPQYKWPEIAFVPQVTSGTVIRFLSAVFSREGDPTELVSDNALNLCHLSLNLSRQRHCAQKIICLLSDSE